MDRDKTALGSGAARDRFTELLNRAAYGDERVVLSRRGKRVAAVVPIEDLDLLERLEDGLDVAEARTALAEWDAAGRPTQSFEEVKRALGLKN